MTARVFQAGIGLALLGEILLLLAGVGRNRWTRYLAGLPVRETDQAAHPTGEMRAGSEIRSGQGRWQRLSVRPLHPAERNWFLQSWRRVQVRFAAAPDRAIDDADRLVSKVMQQRGYLTHELGPRAGSTPPQHALAMKGFQAAHAICVASGRGEATAQDLRQAMAHYRSLFEGLMEVHESQVVVVDSWSDPSSVAAESPPVGPVIRLEETNGSTNGELVPDQVPAQMKGEYRQA